MLLILRWREDEYDDENDENDEDDDDDDDDENDNDNDDEKDDDDSEDLMGKWICIQLLRREAWGSRAKAKNVQIDIWVANKNLNVSNSLFVWQ